jgi:hypothetical protein
LRGRCGADLRDQPPALDVDDVDLVARRSTQAEYEPIAGDIRRDEPVAGREGELREGGRGGAMAGAVESMMSAPRKMTAASAAR